MIKKRHCLGCGGINTTKRGIQDGVQIYGCNDCKHRWRNAKRVTKHHDIWNDFVFHKQTIREICNETGKDKKSIHKYITGYVVSAKEDHRPRLIHLVIDTTYFGKRMDGTSWGVMLFRDADQKENLWWKYVVHESSDGYLEGRVFLEQKGYTILSVTFDGFKGNIKVFKGIPSQICLFHMKQMIVRGTTLRPQTEAGKVLFALSHTLTTTNKEVFAERMRNFHMKYVSFLNEKTLHPDGSRSYTHEGVRSAYLSIIHWYEYLFTFHTNKSIPNTTNTCDGHFSHIKDILRIHRGMSITLKRKVLDSILLESTIAPIVKKKKVEKVN